MIISSGITGSDGRNFMRRNARGRGIPRVSLLLPPYLMMLRDRHCGSRARGEIMLLKSSWLSDNDLASLVKLAPPSPAPAIVSRALPFPTILTIPLDPIGAVYVVYLGLLQNQPTFPA
eukprot:CAMPEP_0198729890 /NCGR_PEP_ID=MMETSP1475-20131203/21566_1 /TAXON_ID= ORGANISM="Unidentified sp., Strain CCMP1999" /NCGR_SAMPLE_ID=MMETSP1475 /ASSEMBLY_ACC=CAM_ASM_001111 /LENGTH=117 /DNA_ID=CAMNT_0044492611 /DNA_START=79 /DNA_END=429 /DNA_ORIENTATION=+